MVTTQDIIEMAEKVSEHDQYSWWTNQYIDPPISEKGADMNKFTEWLMEMYPKTEDYVYIKEMDFALGARQQYLAIKPDPQAFLEQMKDFDEMMEE